MSLLIELRCDFDQCETAAMRKLVRRTPPRVAVALLHSGARKAGWEKVGDDWFCPRHGGSEAIAAEPVKTAKRLSYVGQEP